MTRSRTTRDQSLTQAQAELLFCLWDACNFRPGNGLTYAEMMKNDALKHRGLPMLKKMIHQLHSRTPSPIRSIPDSRTHLAEGLAPTFAMIKAPGKDGSPSSFEVYPTGPLFNLFTGVDLTAPVPKGRRPDLFMLNLENICENPEMATCLVILHDVIQKQPATVAELKKARVNANYNEAYVNCNTVKILNRAHALQYLEQPVTGQDTDPVLFTPKVTLDITFLRILAAYWDPLESSSLTRDPPERPPFP
jgi:hypothetical protein